MVSGARSGKGRLWAGAFAFLLALTGLACAAPAPRSSPGAAAAGKVTRRGAGVPGARVEVYADMSSYLAGRARAATVADGTGGFSIALAPGRYYFAARGPEGGDPGRGLFQFFGSNPVTVAAGARPFLVLALAPVPPPPSFEEDPREPAAGLEGTVTLEGAPVEGAQVFLYLGGEADFRTTAYAVSPPTGPDGEFSFSGLVDTGYFAVARRRAGARSAGPLARGDAYGFYARNPVVLRRGARARIEIPLVEKTDQHAGEGAAGEGARTRIEGRVTDLGGAPRAGVYAFAYLERIMSHAKPAAISAPTGPDGLFVIVLEKGGTYYLGARERYGGNPEPGEYYGKYAGSPDHALTVREGETVRGVTIAVDRVIK